MPRVRVQNPYICAHCLYSRSRRILFRPAHDNGYTGYRKSSSSSPRLAIREDEESSKHEQEAEMGAMSQRLKEMSEMNLEEGGRSAQRSFEEAGFSEELRKKLEARVEDSKFKSDNTSAFAQLNMPVSRSKRKDSRGIC